MRAVNLIPADLRRGGGAGAAGRTGGAIYVIVAALIALVAMAVSYGLTTREISQRKADAATATRQAQIAEARATALQPYVDIQSRRAARVAQVSTIAANRFDWSVMMAQIAEALPTKDVLTTMTGTVSGGSPGSGGPASASSVPTVTLAGCSYSQSGVAATLDSLRKIPGVTVDVLNSSVQGAGAATGCSGPVFSAVVYYTYPTATNAPQAGGAKFVPVATGSGASR